MKRLINIFMIASALLTAGSLHAQQASMDQYGFVYLDEILDNAQYEVRYAGSNNFVGRPVNGYKSRRLVMTKEAAQALQKVEVQLEQYGYGLKIFDTYRPQRAVDHFKTWAKDITDTLTKADFYPEQDKRNLFKLGYIASRSGHSRGSTIDLTIYDLADGEEVDMGGPYDFFGKLSWLDYEDLSITQKRHRSTLVSAMKECGFRPYSKEWWHYTLNGEPYKDQYFDFVVPE